MYEAVLTSKYTNQNETKLSKHKTQRLIYNIRNKLS